MNTSNRLLRSLGIFLLGIIMGASTTYYIINSKTKEDVKQTDIQITENNKKTNHNATYNGIDVSNHQGNIVWEKVASDTNIKFVYIKATEGATHVDKSYKKNIKGARKKGLKVGSYHYLRNSSFIKDQFVNFSSHVDKNLQDLIPMVDVEEKIAKDSILLFCNLIKQKYGKYPMIYGTNKSYNTYCAPDFNDYNLMIGRYGNTPPIITGKGHYNIWQFSQTGNVPGITKPVDMDKFHPDSDLSDFLL